MRFRWIIVALTLLLSVWQLLKPAEEGVAWGMDNIMKNVKLGLDLKGGIFMQLQVDEDDAVRQYLEEQSGLIKGSLEAEGLTIASSSSSFEEKTVTLVGVTGSGEKKPVDMIEDRFDGYWHVKEKGGDVVLELRDQALREVKDEAVNQTVYKIQSRVDELGVTEPVINRTIGSNRIVIELAGADDSNRVQKIVREPGQLEWRLVVPNTQTAPSEAELLASLGRPLQPGEKVLPYPTPEGTSYMLMQNVIMTAKNIADCYPTTDDRGLPAVGVSLDRTGGQTMTSISGQNIGQRLGIVLDGSVVSAPVIQSQLGDRFIIMGLDRKEVPDLVVKIKSGSLPARIDILEERVIGPTLGRDAIESGVKSAVIGVLIVMIFMIAYYRTAGVIANIALLLNMVLILGIMAWIGTVLTLPGIAGYVLIIGMAVDANVLIFERVREELKEGIMPKNAVDAGYKSAFVTILDANITTALAGAILFLLGEGPVKGFATMLCIGIACSIFTAVFCSRTFFLWYLQRNPKMKELSIWPMWRPNTAAGN